MTSAHHHLRNSKSNKALIDELTEDLSLGLILDDRDDSVLGGGWSDEEEEEDFHTPRLLPTLDEDEDDELKLSRKSGRWSSFSWSSLYERATDSSLSWADDELEKETTDKVKALFQSIDACLFDEGESSDRPKTSDSFNFNPGLSEELQNECAIWKERFPHLRVVGKGLLSDHYQVQNVPKRNFRAKISHPTTGASSAMSDVSTLTITDTNNERIINEEEEEEIFASHGTYIDEDKTFHVMEGIVLNEKFADDPKKYFEDKLMTAIFRKVWAKLSTNLDSLAGLHSDWVLQQQSDHVPYSRFGSIDENSIFQGNGRDDYYGASPLAGRMLRKSSSSTRVKSPQSDINPLPLLGYLPDLRPTIASAPPVRELNHGRRPVSSQNVRFAVEGPTRSSRSRPAAKLKRSSTASNARPNSRLTKSRNGKSLEHKRSPSEDRKSANLRRTRSKSGSPPSRVGSSTGFRIGIHAGQPVSLPPIFTTDASSSGSLLASGPTSLTSGYSSMSSRLGTANSSSSVLTPRASSNIRLDGKNTPGIPKSPISISGTKLKKINPEETGRASRLSAKTPVHWDIRTFTPSQARPRFRN